MVDSHFQPSVLSVQMRLHLMAEREMNLEMDVWSGEIEARQGAHVALQCNVGL